MSNEHEKEIDLMELMRSIVRGSRFILSVTFAITAVAVLINFLYLPDLFRAEATIYVLNRQSENTISASDLTAGTQLTNDYKQLIHSKRVMDAAAAALGYANLEGYEVEVKAINDTRFINIAVTGRRAYLAANIANELAVQFSETVVDIMQVDNVSIIDLASVPEEPVAPAKERNIVLTAAVTFLFCAAFMAVRGVLDTTIKTSSDIQAQLDLPVLSTFPYLRILSEVKAPNRKEARR